MRTLTRFSLAVLASTLACAPGVIPDTHACTSNADCSAGGLCAAGQCVPPGPDGGTTQPDGGTTQPDGGTTQPDGGTAQPDGGTTQPDGGTTFAFSIALGPGSQTVAAGATTQYTVGTTVTSGSAQSITLSVSGLPAGVSGTFNPASVSAGAGSTLTLSAAPGTLPESATFTVTGAAATASHSTTAHVTVVSATTSAFSLALGPSSQTVSSGATAQYTVDTAVTSGAAQAIALSVSGLPAGVTGAFNPATVSGAARSTLTLSAASSAPAATATFTVTGAAPSGTQTAAASVTVTSVAATPDFSLSVDAPSVSSAGSATATATLSIAPTHGFSSAVTLSASGVPSGATAAFSPASVAGGSGASTLTLSPGTAVAGTYSLPLSGTGGGATHTAALSWTLTPGGGPGLQTVFLLLMENHNWSAIAGSASAPYINHTLLPQASYALNYGNAPGIHPSMPNYFWLEAGTNFGVLADGLPSRYHQGTQQHLVTLLQTAGISWKSYQEGIDGKTCPLVVNGLYAPKHDPMVYFDDVTNGVSAQSANCIAHVRPYAELATDLQNNRAPRYAFITPDLCDDMHNSTGCATSDPVKNGDTWLSQNVPHILDSGAFKNGGVLLITWDESEGGDVPIGMIVLSPKAKGHGYTNRISYTHASTLRTVEEIFGVSPLLGGAATATDLSDLFTSFP